MPVLVVGGAGFIGSNLVDELMAQGHEVTVLDNLSDGSIAHLERWRGNPKLEFVRGDILDRELVRRVCDHKDWVFHLAAQARIQPSISDPFYTLQNNVMGTVNVLEGARLGGAKRVVYSASSSVTGDSGANQAGMGFPVGKDHPTDIKSPYSLSKLFGEQAMELYHRLYGMSTVSLRYFNVYGPRHQESGAYATVVAIFRKQARLGQPITVVGDGNQRRDFTFVGDVVRANMLAAMNRDVLGVVNVGTGRNYSMLEVAELVAPGHPVEHLPQRQGEYRATLADTSRALEQLGWRAQVDLRTGLEITDRFEQRSPLITLVTR